MHSLVIALLLAILIVEYLIEAHGLLHPYAILIPELLSGIAMLVVLVRLMNGSRISFDWRYGLFMIVLLFTIAFGYAVQDVPTGAMLAGVRSYLKFLPFFLLPAVHRFTSRQLQVQLTLLLVLAVGIETPLAIYQRFVEFADQMHTGDPVRGTLKTSGGFSLFMVTAIAGVVILYLRGRLRLSAMLLLAAWLFLPTMINETRATMVLLPAALLVPALIMPGKRHLMRRMLPLVAIGGIAFAGFVGTYNYFIQYRQYYSSFEDSWSLDKLRYYFYTGAADRDAEYVGRFDSIEFALEHTTQDPLTLAFGLGAGNVSESFLPEFNGRYANYFLRLGVGQTQVTQLLWEVGMVGLLAYLFLFYVVWRDSLLLARSDDHAAFLGQLWVVAMIIMTFALLYKSLFNMNDWGYLFFYFSGVVASRAAAVRRARALRPATKRLPESWRLAIDGPASANR
jgi:hypothetical protein